MMAEARSVDSYVATAPHQQVPSRPIKGDIDSITSYN